MPTAIPLFDEIYTVGDSLYDSGRIFDFSTRAITALDILKIDTTGLHPIPLSPPYFMGRFSNGPVLPEITAELLGATLDNFAFGGAQALGSQTFLDIASPVIPADVLTAINTLPPATRALIAPVIDHDINLAGQVADFVAATTEDTPSAHSALISMIGLNDLRELAATFDPANPLPLLQVVGGIVQASVDLAHTAFHQGIGTVVFETLPAASFFPVARELPPQLQAIGDTAVDLVNLGLQASAFGLRLEGRDVRVVDTARMADEISADPGTFGFQHLDQPAWLGNGIEVLGPNSWAPPPDQTAFFDPVHATTNLHGVLAAFTAESLTSRTVFRGAGNDFIFGLSGDDLVLAGAGNDQVRAGGGNDIVLSGLGNDVADGGQGSDLMAGGTGNDRLSGSDGSDVLAGNAGDDRLEGGNGDDAMIDGLGNDIANGGSGNDWFFATQPQLLGGSGSNVDHFDGGTGFDTLAVLLDSASLAAEQKNVMDNFHSGQPFTFVTMNLTITGIEQIALTTKFGFTGVSLPGGELGGLLHMADLFGFV